MPQGVSRISQRVQDEKAALVDLSTGLMASEKDEIKRSIAIAEAEKKIEAEAIPESSRKMIRQHIKVDMFNILERFVELTPSMCSVQNCGWDAARELGKEYGINDWNRLPIDQVQRDGRTVGQIAVEMKDRHEATAHSLNERNSHIISEAELKRRQQTQGAVFSVR